MDWIIYYHTGVTYSSLSGRPQDAPKHGVQIILSKFDYGWAFMEGADYYVYREYEDGFGEWYRAKVVTDLVSQLVMNAHEVTAVVEGYTMRETNWRALHRRATRHIAKLRGD